MKIRTFAALALAFLLLLGCAGAGLIYFLRNGSQSVPLENANGNRAPLPLPKDAIVLTVSDGAEAVAPFLLHDESGAVGGIAAYLPKGSRTDEQLGRIKFSAQAAAAGSYNAWVHAKWRDTCSNSCSLKVGAGLEPTVGNDDVFSVWHWVPAGKHTFAQGANPVAILEREDGVFIDQILFTQNAEYAPSGAISTAGVLRDIRRFADTFTRSPGHGNEGWEFSGKGKFEIAFSFDPNRIPNQYALAGDATDGPAYAFVKGPSWYGCKVSYSFLPVSDGEYGCVLESEGAAPTLSASFGIHAGNISAGLKWSGGDFAGDLPKGALRLNQWHRVVVERWAKVTRIWLDGAEILSNCAVSPKAGGAGLFVASGKAVFDDFEIEEIPWMADDGKDLKIDWTLTDGAKWKREMDEQNGPIMVGESGSIKAGLGGIPLVEVVVMHPNPGMKPGAPGTLPEISAPGLEESQGVSGGKTLRLPKFAEGSCTHATFNARELSGLQFVALRFGRPTQPVFNVGPYTFAAAYMEDPSDYLDFTQEEFLEMAKSPEAAKLKRRAKLKPVIDDGSEEQESPWVYTGGNWQVDTTEGCLQGNGANAVLRHAQEISSDLEMHFKIRLAGSKSAAEVELYWGGSGNSVRARFAAAKPAAPSPNSTLTPATQPIIPNLLNLTVAPDGQWHEVSLRVEGSKLSAKVDRDALKEAPVSRGEGDRIYLKILRGAADFDDVEFVVQRQTPRGYLYAFNQPEPDWWREPADHWIDHGGIACVLASNWVSLVAPDSKAKMWNKREFASNVSVAFNVEENTEWYGWDRWPNHIHFPFVNIETELVNAKNPALGYTLAVNAEGHTATILYRNGKEVARVNQDSDFPMTYVGSHMPFQPRTNRIALTKRGGMLSAMVNGKEVLTYKDPQPLEVSKVGVGGHDTRVNFSHIEIRNLDEIPAGGAPESTHERSSLEPATPAPGTSGEMRIQ